MRTNHLGLVKESIFGMLKIQSIFAKFWGVRCLEPGLKKKKWAGPWEMLTEMGSMVKKKTLKEKQNADSQRRLSTRFVMEMEESERRAATEEKQGG